MEDTSRRMAATSSLDALRAVNNDRIAIREWLEDAMVREPGSEGLRALYELLLVTPLGKRIGATK